MDGGQLVRNRKLSQDKIKTQTGPNTRRKGGRRKKGVSVRATGGGKKQSREQVITGVGHVTGFQGHGQDSTK